jgi:hypothetical protein
MPKINKSMHHCPLHCHLRHYLRWPSWPSPLRGRRTLRHGYVSGAAPSARTHPPRGRAWRRCARPAPQRPSAPAPPRDQHSSTHTAVPQHAAFNSFAAVKEIGMPNAHGLPACQQFASSLASDARLCLIESAATRHSVLFSMQLVALSFGSRSPIVADLRTTSTRFLTHCVCDCTCTQSYSRMACSRCQGRAADPHGFSFFPVRDA